jgi:hypothetical protein
MYKFCEFVLKIDLTSTVRSTYTYFSLTIKIFFLWVLNFACYFCLIIFCVTYIFDYGNRSRNKFIIFKISLSDFVY